MGNDKISKLYGSPCLNSYVPNTFILGDSCVRVKALKKSVTSSYKVNKGFLFKVFCAVFLWGVCECVCVSVHTRMSMCVCVVFLLRMSREKPSMCVSLAFLFSQFCPTPYAYMQPHRNTPV